MQKKIIWIFQILPLLMAMPLRTLADTLQNPLCSTPGCTVSILSLFSNLLQAAMYLGVPIAVLFVVLVGFKFVTARGDTAKIAEARRNFLYTVVGIGIFFGATLITEVIINTLRQFGVSFTF
jgi:hypothetical protein